MSQENFLQQNFAARIGGSNFGKDTKFISLRKSSAQNAPPPLKIPAWS